MTIRKRIEEAQALLVNGYDEASLIIALVAVAAAARRVYPKGQFRDEIAFTSYLEERILRTITHGTPQPNAAFMLFSYKNEQRTISQALYKEFRCNLIHEGELPEGIRLDGDGKGLSISVGDNHLVLGRDWLHLLIDVVINDPSLRPMFDDLRRKAADDLAFKGTGDESDFSEAFINHFSQSEGRLNVIKRFIANVGTKNLRGMDDAQLSDLWGAQVSRNPEAFGLDGSCLTGLSSSRGFDGRENSYLSRAQIGGGLSITAAGVEMTRYLLDHYD